MGKASGAKAGSCTVCEAGKRASGAGGGVVEAGASVCTICEVGKASGEGAVNCELCGVGKFAGEAGHASPCEVCGEAEVSFVNATDR